MIRRQTIRLCGISCHPRVEPCNPGVPAESAIWVMSKWHCSPAGPGAPAPTAQHACRCSARCRMLVHQSGGHDPSRGRRPPLVLWPMRPDSSHGIWGFPFVRVQLRVLPAEVRRAPRPLRDLRYARVAPAGFGSTVRLRRRLAGWPCGLRRSSWRGVGGHRSCGLTSFCDHDPWLSMSTSTVRVGPYARRRA